jgi:membrane-associated HD superfamily phosphohydrolase
MKKLKQFTLNLVVPVASLALPLLAAAQVGGGAPVTAPTAAVTSLSAVGQSLCNITNWLFYFLIILAVLFIIVAAFKYLTAAGEPEKVKSASHMLLYAAIAIVVGIVAKAVPSLIGSVLNSGTAVSC